MAVYLKIRAPLIIFLINFIEISSIASAAHINENQSEADASKANAARIEIDNTTSLPLLEKQALADFLKKEYLGNKSHLSEINPQLTATSSTEHFTDKDFDTNKLFLINQSIGLRHRKRVNITNPEDRKNERELVQIKSSAGDLAREEIKFNVDTELVNKKNIDDRHPLISIIKRDEREAFKQRVAALNVTDPYSLRQVLVLNQERQRTYLSDEGKPFITLSLDIIRPKKWWATVSFVSLEVELNEVTYTQGTAKDREFMSQVYQKIVQEIQAVFPRLEQDLRAKHKKVFDVLARRIPFLSFFIRLGIA